jgi:peroxiredoxin Q/BCP
MATIDVGSPAPTFELPADDGNTVRLGDLAGKWVIVYFYPRDSTPGCTTEACDFRDNHIRLRDELDAVVLGVSGDSLKSHVRFRDKHELPFRLLSDVEHDMMEQWGAWGDKKMYGRTFKGVIRSTYIVDPNGQIAAAWPKVRVKGHVDDVIATLTSLKSS